MAQTVSSYSEFEKSTRRKRDQKNLPPYSVMQRIVTMQIVTIQKYKKMC